VMVAIHRNTDTDTIIGLQRHGYQSITSCTCSCVAIGTIFPSDMVLLCKEPMLLLMAS